MAQSIVKPLDVHSPLLDQPPPSQDEDLSHSNEPELIYGVPAADYWGFVKFVNDWYSPKEESMPRIYRSVFENGQLVKKPAHEYAICLRDKLPEGCDKDSFYLSFLKKVCSDTDAAYCGPGDIDDPIFFATLTDDEFKSLIGMDEVASAEDCGVYAVQF